MNRKIFGISVIVLAIDQITKACIWALMHVGEQIPIIKDFFYITYHQNYGAAWGFLQNTRWFLVIASLIVLILIYSFMYSFKQNKRNNIAFGLITGGIVGNLIDRLIQGYVVDFFDFLIFGYDFPVFNISDMAIVIGVALLIVAIIKGEDSSAKDRSKGKPGEGKN